MTAVLSSPARILVPLDGSPASDLALDAAVEIARRSKADLKLVRIHSPYMSGLEVVDLDLEADEMVRHAEQTWIEESSARIGQQLGRPVTGEVHRGEVAATIAQLAEEWQADLVVMATHARKPAARFWLGGVADRLLRTLNRPLLLIPPGASTHPWRDLRRILVPLDGSPFAGAILAEAQRIGALFGATFILYQAVEEPTPVVDPTGAVVLLFDEESVEQRVVEARSQLERYATAVRSGGAGATVVAAGANGAAPGILAAAAAGKVDLIAMATHGRDGLRRLWFGSVAEHVIRRSAVPLLILHPPA